MAPKTERALVRGVLVTGQARYGVVGMFDSIRQVTKTPSPIPMESSLRMAPKNSLTRVGCGLDFGYSNGAGYGFGIDHYTGTGFAVNTHTIYLGQCQGIVWFNEVCVKKEIFPLGIKSDVEYPNSKRSARPISVAI